MPQSSQRPAPCAPPGAPTGPAPQRDSIVPPQTGQPVAAAVRRSSQAPTSNSSSVGLRAAGRSPTLVSGVPAGAGQPERRAGRAGVRTLPRADRLVIELIARS